MPDDDDIALSEKRMYGERRVATRAYVASHVGIAAVDASDDQIGRFSLVHQCSCRDVAGADGRLVVATDEDVLVGSDGGFEPAAFGPAVAVGVGANVLAAGPDGRVAALRDGEWESVGHVDDVRAIDCEPRPPGATPNGRARAERRASGDLVAAADGVYRVDGGDGLTLNHVGLDDVRDVASAGAYAATGNGLHSREDGWSEEVGGEATVVATEWGAGGRASEGEAGGRTSGASERRAHAVVDGTLLERVGGRWRETDAPDGDVVDVAYDEATFAVTVDGQVLLDPVTAKDGSPGWRTRSLGVADVVGVAVP